MFTSTKRVYREKSRLALLHHTGFIETKITTHRSYLLRWRVKLVWKDHAVIELQTKIILIIGKEYIHGICAIHKHLYVL